MRSGHPLPTSRAVSPKIPLWFSLTLVSVLSGCGAGATMSPDLSREELLEIRCGMGLSEVVDRIGLPLEVLPQLKGRPLDSTLGAALTGGYHWIYARPGPFGGGLEATVQISPEGKVGGVYLEEFDGGIYHCTPHRCPWFIKPDRLRALVPERRGR